MTTMQVFSSGAGRQSIAALVLAAEGRIPFRTHLFCNVGDRAENPDTLAYWRDVAVPFAKRHGLEAIELRRYHRDGTPYDLYDELMRDGSRSIDIPVRMKNGAPGRRSCTVDYKIKVIARWCKKHGATATEPALVALGISLDEYQRMRTDSGIPHIKHTYPLIDLRMTRRMCEDVITAAGLGLPPKSSCDFCPYHTVAAWQDMARTKPQRFARIVNLETTLNERLRTLGRDPVYFTSRLVPLARLSSADAQAVALFTECESGYCGV